MAGDRLFDVLVARPAARLNRGGLVMAAYAIALAMLGMFVIAAPIAPELIALAVTIDLALFVELAALLVVARTVAWSRTLSDVVRRAADMAPRVLRPPGRSRRGAPPRRAARKPPPEPDPGWRAIAA